MRTVCFTSFTYAYLSRARVLARGLRRVHPNWAIHAVIPDLPPEGLGNRALDCFDQVVPAHALGIPAFPAWMFRHDLVEAATAVKGAMLRRILAEPGVANAVYLDPDIAVFAPLDPLLAAPDGPAVVLTPHQITPNDAGVAYQDAERTSLRYGIYNLGFLSVANDGDGRAFAAWWAARLHEACYDAVEDGIFTDQKYCDLVPGLFRRVKVSRDPGANVASWNLSRRTLGFDAQGMLRVRTPEAEGRLRFFHFTKVASRRDAPPAVGDVMIERYAGENVVPHEVLHWYKGALEAESDPAAAAHPWAYGRFEDGTPVPRAARLLWRATPALAERFPNPFGGAFLEHLRAHHASVLAPEGE